MVNAPETERVRYVSTGRGGAANFKKTTNLAEKQPVVARRASSSTTTEEQDCELTRVTTKASLGARFATGRGGRGNFLPEGEVPLPAETKPLESRPRTNVIVGRGGAGNFKDAKSGRSASATSAGRPVDLGLKNAAATTRTDRPIWGTHVPRIDDAFDDNAIEDDEADYTSQTGRTASIRSAPATTSLFGKIRRRLSSFGTAIE